MSDDEPSAKRSRCVNNPKGREEMLGFKALGVKLSYHGNAVETGLELYESSRLDRSLQEYGLEESRYDLERQGRKVVGKKLLWIHTRALQHIFNDAGISKYEDIWREEGAVERRARQASQTSRGLAVHHFGESLKERGTQAKNHGADKAHQGMIDAMRRCIRRIADMDRPKALPKSTNMNPPAPAGFSFGVLDGLDQGDVSMEEVDSAQGGSDEDGHGQVDDDDDVAMGGQHAVAQEVHLGGSQSLGRGYEWPACVSASTNTRTLGISATQSGTRKKCMVASEA